MAVKVGSFTKATGGAPASQAVTGVGFQPKALLLWTACQTATGSWNAGTVYAIGMTDGSTSRSGCEGLEDNVSTTDTTRRYAAKALTILDYNTTLLAECDLTSFDADGFTLSWTTNNASAYVVHYLAIGGSQLTNAKLVEWTIPATAPGTTAVTGVGFQPDLVFHLSARMAAAGNSDHAALSFGAMSAAGGQCCVANAAIDNYGAAEGTRSSASNRCHQLLNVISGENGGSQFSSMDADGFTVNRVVQYAAAHLVASLCLRGGSYKVGSFNEKDSTGDQAITGAGFLPEGVLILAGCTVAWPADPWDMSAARLTGAGDGSTQAAACFFYNDVPNPTQSDATSRTDALIVAGGHAASDQDVATLKSLDADGFTLTWSATTNTAHDYGYVALLGGPAAAALRLLPATGAGT